MSKEKKITLSDVSNNLNQWIENADDIKPILENSDFEEVMEFLKTTLESGEKSWMVQSDIIRYFHDRAKYGKKVVKELASELGLSKSYCYDLLNINKEIFDKDPNLRQAAILNVSHFAYVIKNLKRIPDPVILLQKAVEESWSVQQLKSHIMGRPVEKVYISTYYKVTEDDTVNDDTEWSTATKLSNTSNLLKDGEGNVYLELKTLSE